MNLKCLSRRLLFFLLSVCSFKYSPAQLNEAAINQYFSGKDSTSELAVFYSSFGFRPVWFGIDETRLISFNRLLANAEKYALQSGEYEFKLVRELLSRQLSISGLHDSLKIEIEISKSFLLFLRHIAYGNQPPHLSHNGLRYNPQCMKLPQLLADLLPTKSPEDIVAILEPANNYYLIMKNRLGLFLEELEKPGFTDKVLRYPADSGAILERLRQLKVTEGQTGINLKQQIILAQRMFGLAEDGSAGRSTIAALNIPLTRRIVQLNRAINYLRWLNCSIVNSSTAIVNIPSASLSVLYQDNRQLFSRLVLGKSSSPTPQFSSTITEVILYPYWHVPKSIAINEMLPTIRRNPGYLPANNYQVLNSSGKVVNPYSIDWNSISGSNFPYTIRQGTGCDNALGLVKLNFSNPFSVYLHDTPSKSLFQRSSRFYSHGCMRLQKAADLGRMLLDTELPLFESTLARGCAGRETPLVFDVDKPMPLFVIYSTAWVTEEGGVAFYQDIYNRE